MMRISNKSRRASDARLRGRSEKPSVAKEVFATVPRNFNDFRAEPEQFIDGGEKWGTLTAIDARQRARPVAG
jgi:hypothetical protein